MPIFEYLCRKCGKVFEKLVLSRQAPSAVCPACGSKQVEQRFSAFSTSSASPRSTASCAPAGGG